MKAVDIIPIVILVIVFIGASFAIGVSVDSNNCIGYLDDGRKFVSTEDGSRIYLLGERIWVDKLPNGFYRER